MNSKKIIEQWRSRKDRGGIVRRNTAGAIGKGIMRPRYRSNKVL